MSDRPASDSADSFPESSERNPLEKRQKRREHQTRNTLVWREMAIIAALGVVILAFNLDWGTPENNRDMAAKAHDEIRLQDVRVAPPEPEPEPQRQPQPEPKPQVQQNQERTEVPDEELQEEPPKTESKPVAIENLKSTPSEATSSEPAPQATSEAPPKPKMDRPKEEVFSQGTVDENAQMKGPIEVEYPRRARDAGIEGQVILQFVVDESGRPQSIEVLRSPNKDLSEAAIAALKKKSFTPARQNGRPVKMRMTQPVSFRLQ